MMMSKFVSAMRNSREGSQLRVAPVICGLPHLRDPRSPRRRLDHASQIWVSAVTIAMGPALGRRRADKKRPRPGVGTGLV
jgi:hypothetical protein